jgi:hypothetical protein
MYVRGPLVETDIIASTISTLVLNQSICIETDINHLVVVNCLLLIACNLSLLLARSQISLG